MFRHLLPNAIAGSIVFAMSDAVLVLLSGAAVSYLGLGSSRPVANGAFMVAEGQSFITTAGGSRCFRAFPSCCLAFGFSMLATRSENCSSARMSVSVLLSAT